MGTPLITNAGAAKIAAVQGASGVLSVDRFMLANIAGLVDTDPVNPLEATPIGGDQVYVGAVTQSGYVNPDSVVYSLHLDTSVGDFDFNWMALLADDDTLMAVQYFPSASKIATAGPVPGNNLTRNFLMQ